MSVMMMMMMMMMVVVVVVIMRSTVNVVAWRRSELSRQLPVLTASQHDQTGHLSTRDAGDRLRGDVHQELRHGRRLRRRRRRPWTTTTWWRHGTFAPAQVLLQRLWMDVPATHARFRRSANKYPVG